MNEYTCIVCPRGCRLKAEKVMENGQEVIKVTGNFCPRGARYATEEMTCPMRTVTTSVYVEGGTVRMLSCKTDDTVPKEKIGQVLREAASFKAKAPVRIGDVLIENVAGTGRSLVATRSVKAL